MRVGDIVVAPPDETAKSMPGIDFKITIAPSMGFGTGHHASTRLCLALIQRSSVAGMRVLDVGTGSGVLALAAWKLGARDVVATDYDPDALSSARENLERNGATDAIQLVLGDLACLPSERAPALEPRFDLLLANLTGGVLIRHAVTLAGHLGPGGRLIASGFQEDEDAAVTSAFEKAGLTRIERLAEQEWVGAVFTSPISSRAC